MIKSLASVKPIAGLLVFVFHFQLRPRTVYIWSSGTDRDTTTLHQRLVETENLLYTKMSQEQQLSLRGQDENGKCILIQSLRYSLTSLKIVKMVSVFNGDFAYTLHFSVI